MAQQKGIGRLIQVGIAKETTRGTAPASATYWVPWADVTLDEKQDGVFDTSAYGVIEDGISRSITKKYMEGSITGNVGDTTFGLLLLSTFGTMASFAAHGFEAAIYDNKFTVAESAIQQSLAFYIHDPLAAQDYYFANGVVAKLEFSFVLKQFLQYTATIKALAGVAHANYTPATTAENKFVPQYATVNLAPQIAGAATAQEGTGTAATTTAVTALSISTDLLAVGMYVVGTNITSGTTISAIGSVSALTLSGASTGNASDLHFGTMYATGTASSTIHVTALGVITTAKLRVGMTVKGTNIPAGTTITAIVSSTAFDMSAASTGVVSGMVFGGAAIAVKSAKITITKNIEDQETLGNVAPADFLNKEYSVDGTIEAIFQNESDFKTGFLAGSATAMLIDVKNTDVTVGTGANPELILTLAKAYITDLGRPLKVKDLVYQQIKFKAVYSTGDTSMIGATLTNAVAGY